MHSSVLNVSRYEEELGSVQTGSVGQGKIRSVHMSIWYTGGQITVRYPLN